MIAQFLEDVDGFQWLRPHATKQFLNFGRGDEKLIKCGLYRTEVAEDNMFVFDRHYLQGSEYISISTD